MAIVITSPNNFSFPVGLAITSQFIATGGFPPYRFSTQSALPTGVKLLSNGRITGIPTANQVRTIILSARDTKNAIVSKSITIRTVPLPVGSALLSWGFSLNGELGTNAPVDKMDSPVHVGTNLNWRNVDAGFSVGGGIKADGTLWMWGKNSYGTLGNNRSINVKSPVQTIARGKNWKEVNIAYHVAAIKTDGTLWMWGEGSYGQLGNNQSVSQTLNKVNQSSPVQNISFGNKWKKGSCGSFHEAAVKKDGSLWIRGSNAYGGAGIAKSSPIQTIAFGTNWKQASCGNFHTAAIKTDGTLWCWGDNSYGQLGTNSVKPVSSPIQTIAGGNNWKQVACGHFHTAAIKNDGTLWLWGKNDNFIPDRHKGALGDNTTIDRSSPVQTIAGGNNWKQVSCGFSFTAATKTDGTLWLWGDNGYGELGINNTINKSSPVQTISGGTNWNKIDCGLEYMSAIKTDGTLWLWGYNYYGQLGDSFMSYSTSSPVQTIMRGTGWIDVSAGAAHTSAIYKTV